MNWTRRDFLKTALALPAGAWLANYQAMAAPYAKMVKITAIKTLQLDNVDDGCLIRIETDSGLTGYGESGISSKLARDRIETIQQTLIGQDPLAIERHFYRMSALQYSFVAHIPDDQRDRYRAMGPRRKDSRQTALSTSGRPDARCRAGLFAR